MFGTNAQTSITCVTSRNWWMEWHNQLAHSRDMVTFLSDMLANIANKLPHSPCTLCFSHGHNIFAYCLFSPNIHKYPHTHKHWAFTSGISIEHEFVQFLAHFCSHIDMTFLHTHIALTLSHYTPHNHMWTYLLIYKLCSFHSLLHTWLCTWKIYIHLWALHIYLHLRRTHWKTCGKTYMHTCIAHLQSKHSHHITLCNCWITCQTYLYTPHFDTHFKQPIHLLLSSNSHLHDFVIFLT